jgi:carbon storage regulator
VLILERKSGEQICIGDDCVITLLEVVGPNRVRLGIVAPRTVRVDRAEIRAAKDAADRQAKGDTP